MSTTLYVVASFTIQPGKSEEFMRLGEQALEIVRTNDTGTTHYEWFYNEDKTQCTVLEGYVDSNACLVHLGGVQGVLGEILKISELSAKVLGEVSPELKQAAAGLNLEFQANHAVAFAAF